MKKIIAISLIFFVMTIALAFKSFTKVEAIVIYTSTEDYNMELLQDKLNEQFPDYEIEIEYLSTSNIATKIIEEKDKCECDIVYALDYGYLDKLIAANCLASFAGEYDMSIFEDDTLSDTNRNYVLPTIRSGGGIILNNSVLNERGIEKPTCYNDLLKPEYRGWISMPSPKSSGTGYMFYYSLVQAWGEEVALEYFDGFAENVKSFTSSGSGPVNAITTKEAAIGLGMISQAVDKITNGNKDIEVVFFEEGAPYSLYGTSVIKGRESKLGVMEVMDYIYSNYINEACKIFYPEKILKNKQYDVANFPSNINYSNMIGNTLETKENLLNKWKY